MKLYKSIYLIFSVGNEKSSETDCKVKMGPDIVPFSPPRINGDRWLSSLHDEKFIEVEQTKLVKIFHC